MNGKKEQFGALPRNRVFVNEPLPGTKEHPFLEGLTQHQFQLMTDCAMQTHFEAGEIIFSEGDPADCFYLIQKGEVALECHTKNHGLALIQMIGDGDVIGWSWLFPPYFWHFGARAMEPTDALSIRASALRDECEADHELGYALTKRMAWMMMQRLQKLRQRSLEDE